MRYDCEAFAATKQGYEARVRVTASSPFFRGHFEGEPVLPAAALLVIAHEVLARRVAARPELRGLGGARFRRPIPPQAELTLRWTLTAGPDVDLEVHHDAALAAGARLRFAGPVPRG